jgi:hypothetical protein|uniref:Uncharacterized protein n=1 Tax=Podoviridae sp. ctiuS14 TaxID=2827620 RepID=A0A8S5LMC2_9CAUD|nr:MAG TPA: hypothetical protein [Podoviridae sp. ctiuS14]
MFLTPLQMSEAYSIFTGIQKKAQLTEGDEGSMFYNFSQINSKYEIGIPFYHTLFGNFLTDYEEYYSSDFSKEYLNRHIIPALNCLDLLFNNRLLEDPVKISTPMSFYSILELCSKIPDLYGVAIYDTKRENVFNPLHPVTALTLLDFKDLLGLEKEIFIPIFYRLQEKVISNKNLYNLENMDIPSLNYDKIMNTVFEAVSKKSFNIASKPNPEALDLKLYEKSLDEILNRRVRYNEFFTTQNLFFMEAPSKEEELFILIPHQILTQGTYVPYYGMSIVSNFSSQNSTEGLHMTPMLSNNISFLDYLEAVETGEVDDYDNPEDETPEYNLDNNVVAKYYDTEDINVKGSVCTGNEDNRKFSAIVNTNMSNAGNAYCMYTLLPGWLSWAEYARDYALKIYKEAQWIK